MYFVFRSSTGRLYLYSCVLYTQRRMHWYSKYHSPDIRRTSWQTFTRISPKVGCAVQRFTPRPPVASKLISHNAVGASKCDVLRSHTFSLMLKWRTHGEFINIVQTWAKSDVQRWMHNLFFDQQALPLLFLSDQAKEVSPMKLENRTPRQNRRRRLFCFTKMGENVCWKIGPAKNVSIDLFKRTLNRTWPI